MKKAVIYAHQPAYKGERLASVRQRAGCQQSLESTARCPANPRVTGYAREISGQGGEVTAVIASPHHISPTQLQAVPLQKVRSVHRETFALTLSQFPVPSSRCQGWFLCCSSAGLCTTHSTSGGQNRRRPKAAFPIAPASSDHLPEAQE